MFWKRARKKRYTYVLGVNISPISGELVPIPSFHLGFWQILGDPFFFWHVLVTEILKAIQSYKMLLQSVYCFFFRDTRKSAPRPLVSQIFWCQKFLGVKIFLVSHPRYHTSVAPLTRHPWRRAYGSYVEESYGTVSLEMMSLVTLPELMYKQRIWIII